ncbi:MAG: hypothetical protein WCJ39_08085 [bacterium]
MHQLLSQNDEKPLQNNENSNYKDYYEELKNLIETFDDKDTKYYKKYIEPLKILQNT